MNDQRKFLLILALMVLLCIGTALAVLILLPHGEENENLLRQVDGAGLNQKILLEKLDAMGARVRELEAQNARLLAEGRNPNSGVTPGTQPEKKNPSDTQ